MALGGKKPPNFMTFSQSNIKCKRTFRAWFYEYRLLCASLAALMPIQTEIPHNVAEMYYNGGYSPKMVIHEINRIPAGKDII